MGLKDCAVATCVPRLLATLLIAVVAGGCATRPVNPRIERFEAKPYSLERPSANPEDRQNFVLLAFSGGGTRAAAFSYGALETLRDMEITTRSGRKVRALDEVDVITGISGGSFTALAYGLYGDKLFDEYEKRFLKRDVQGELIARAFNPFNWGNLASSGWGRSELAANYYDEILFNGATYADLKPDGPRIFVGTTDISEGTRIVFNKENFDIFCSDLGTFRLARAAAASSAVPVVLSSITIDNYGGTCDYRFPPWTKMFFDNPNPPRPAARTLKRLEEMKEYGDRAKRPYLHLVDGGVSDNIGMRGALDVFATFEALHTAGVPTPFDRVRNIFVFIVNSLAEPPNDWDMHENPPGTFDVLIKATGTPIDRYSYDTVETLKDMQARWQMLREVRDTVGPVAARNPKLTFIERAPNIDIHVIDVSFAVLKDAAERDYLNRLPTSFVLPDEAVDRLRAAARKALLESPVIQQLMKQGVVQMPGAPAH
ncbi:MAG TPA: patatin-like phospholipase family protein [Casimicrobiaceae bacterium]|nr:patatin-like phospholipase family protein [Casimicrobiaceae bacterium]